LSTLLLAGIREVLIITTPEHSNQFRHLLGDGHQWGLSLSYIVQHQPRGLADAFILGQDFVGKSRCALILGDNIFYGHGLTNLLQSAASRTSGATIFAHKVREPERYGIVDLDECGRAVSIVEKPVHPASRWAVTGLYFYDNEVIEMARALKPSARGEIEITDINNIYLKRGAIQVEVLGRGYAWFDAGTPQSLLEASEFVHTIEHRQGLKVACLEEIAHAQGYIDREQFTKVVARMPKSNYGQYLAELHSEREGEG
jgi:glucose-1-phosphate thymidylyltransferase